VGLADAWKCKLTSVDNTRVQAFPENELDAVAAYDRLSLVYPALAEARRQYLAAIEDLIIQFLPSGSRSLLDVGAGDGRRAAKIASRAGISTVVLLEPSRGMSREIPESSTLWNMRAEELVSSGQFQQFDVITCLWNVFGHIRPAANRALVLHKLHQRLRPGGRLMLDVNHRYNARAYGKTTSILRYLRDHIRPGESNGDVTVRWLVNGAECSTHGHVYSNREILQLAASADLKIEHCIAIDYKTGSRTRFPFQGNLFYVLKIR
jgi:SAM-dependent methyltransferase